MEITGVWIPFETGVSRGGGDGREVFFRSVMVLLESLVMIIKKHDVTTYSGTVKHLTCWDFETGQMRTSLV